MSDIQTVPTLPYIDGVSHSYVDLPGLRMHVAEAGVGEPVLLLHGFPQNWWEWRKVIKGLAEQYRVICPDLRGAGWSDAPLTGYTTDELLTDVVALLDALELDRVQLISHEWGAFLGYQLCLRHPDRVNGHLALSVAPPFCDYDSAMMRSILRTTWWHLAFPVPLVGPLLLGARGQRMVRRMLVDHASGPDTFSAEDIEIFAGQFRDRTRARAGSALFRGFMLPEPMRASRGEYRTTRLSTPTRVLLGADDPNVRPEFLHGYEGYVDDVALEYVEGAKHFVADDSPDVVVDRALKFFAKA